MKKTELKPTITNVIQRKKLASGVMKNAISIGTKKSHGFRLNC